MDKAKIEELMKNSIRTLNTISVPVGLAEEIMQPILFARNDIGEALAELAKEEPAEEEQTEKNEG